MQKCSTARRFSGDKTLQPPPTATSHGHQGAAQPPHSHHNHPQSLYLLSQGSEWSPNCHGGLVVQGDPGEEHILLLYFP